jgi:hypothetical protein
VPDSLRLRQIHLDFHTARDISDVGVDFDPAEFAATAADAAVDSMTVFAKCHHGYSYYPTEVGTVHPSLTFDLLGAQIEALHARGIRAPIYVSILWDDLAGEEHTDWVITSRDGTTRMRAPLSDHSPLGGQVGWTTMDVATGYGDYVRAQVAELCDRYPVDGFFFDIVWVEPNYSPVGQRRLREAGVSLANEAAVHEHARGELEAFMTGLSELVRKSVPDATIFYNGIVDADLAYSLPAQTHIEVESLPTSGSLWGYTHYPVVARYARTLNKPILGMTGRFHRAWADFGGLKTASQLEYECGTILSAGGAISVGDQLDPRGRLEPAVYRMVGQVFRRIRDLEPWLVGARPTAEVAILGAAERKPHGARSVAAHTPEVEGAAQMLLELGVQFDIVDPETEDLARYAAVIVPDAHVPSATAAARLDTARRAGTHLILSGTAAVDRQSSRFVLADVPVSTPVPAPTVPSYFRPTEPSPRRPDLATDYWYAFYGQAYQVQPQQNAETSGELSRARYTRSWEHFTSHAQAPVGEKLPAPLIVTGDNITYLAAPLFGAYARNDYWVYRALVEQVVDRALPSRLLRLHGPAWIEAVVHEQITDGRLRHVVHLTAYHPRRTGQPVPHVDESWLTAGIRVSLHSGGRDVAHVYLAPGDQNVDWDRDADTINVTLPPIGTHTVLVIEYEGPSMPSETNSYV